MLKDQALQVINVALRGLTLVCKFLLVFFLAKLMDSKDVGMYGLLSATIGYFIYVVGFEFYTFSNREMIGSCPSSWLGMMKDQLVLYCLVYLAVLPIVYFIFFNGWLPSQYLSWFLILLMFEQIAQEANRILVAMAKPLVASVVLFLRSGLWCLVVVTVMYYVPVARTLEFTLMSWGVGCLFACAFAGHAIFSLDRTSLRKRVDWGWIRKGIKITIPLLLASLAVRGIFTLDRYWVEDVAGLDVLGAYILFVGMATAILSFVDAGVVVFIFPKMVASAKLNDGVSFRRHMKELLLSVTVVSISLAVVLCVSSEYLLTWVDKAVYVENLYILYWLLLGMVLYSLSMIPHLGLYAFGYDKPIFYSQFAGFLVFLIVGYFGGKLFGMIAVPVAIVLAFFVVAVWKLIAYRSMRLKQQ